MQQLIVIILHSSVVFAGAFLYHTTVLFYFQLFLRFIVVFMSFHFICNGHLSALCLVALLCYVRWTSQLFVIWHFSFSSHTRCSTLAALFLWFIVVSMSAIVFLHVQIIICNGHHRTRALSIVHRVSMLDERYLSCCQAAPSSADVFKVTFGNNAEFVSGGITQLCTVGPAEY
jgi:hypothetical protein